MRRLIARASEILAHAYADDPQAAEAADLALALVGDDVSPMASYVWYCAGEAHVRGDAERARPRREAGYNRTQALTAHTRMSSTTLPCTSVRR